MIYEFVKVFGERNSGTNFVNLLLQVNGLRARVLEKEKDFLPAEIVRRYAEADRNFFVERYLDQLDRGEFRRNFGWKHACVSIERLAAQQMYERSFFILLVRNPYYFAASLHRRGYNLLPSVAPDRKTFMRTALIANERDHLENIHLPNPLSLWNHKVLSFVEMASKASNACLVRYEDLMSDPTGFIDWLSRAGLAFSHNGIVPVASTKNDPLGFADYRDKALNFDPSREWDSADLSFIESQLNVKLTKMLGYDQGLTTFGATRWANPRFSFLED